MTSVAGTGLRRMRRRHFAGLGLLALLLASCEGGKPPSRPSRPQQKPSASRQTETRPRLRLSPAAEAPPARPPGTPTGTFIDRHERSDLRVMSYNILWNNIFAEVSERNADKFVRVVRALNPDILALQEIGVTRGMLEDNPNARVWNAADVVCLMNAIVPLEGGASWHAHKGKDNVIVSKYPLGMKATDTNPRGEREQAMALVDLPDNEFGIDLYILNNHYKCCDPARFDSRRQKQSDAITSWIRDARTLGGHIDLPERTAIAVVGDLNIVGSLRPIQTLLEGDIVDEGQYGKDFPPDWDGTPMTDAHPLHNIDGPDDYTWRNDEDQWDPGRLDFIIYTDSVLEAVKTFVLNTTTMSEEDLRAAGLQKYDITVDDVGREYDHLPLIVDFR